LSAFYARLFPRRIFYCVRAYRKTFGRVCARRRVHFLVTRAIAEGVRVAAIALVVSVVLGTSERLAVFIVIALTIVYTFEGGMKGRHLD